jgi:hypothetical protein
MITHPEKNMRTMQITFLSLRPAPLPRVHSESLFALIGGTDSSDLAHTYHHLRSGCVLSLLPVTGGEGRFMFHHVMYGPYHLGLLDSRLSQRILELQANGVPYRVTVSRIDREKYMPPRAIEVELEWSVSAMAA